MSTWGIRSEQDRDTVIKLIQKREIPFTVNLTKGAPRSIEQNKLGRLWFNELAEQGDQTAEEYRAYCKLHVGVPILRNENEKFREAYDRVIRPLDYELKLQAMAVPLDFPTSRLMTTRQKAKYLDRIYEIFTANGFVLTRPNDGDMLS